MCYIMTLLLWNLGIGKIQCCFCFMAGLFTLFCDCNCCLHAKIKHVLGLVPLKTTKFVPNQEIRGTGPFDHVAEPGRANDLFLTLLRLTGECTAKVLCACLFVCWLPVFASGSCGLPAACHPVLSMFLIHEMIICCK